MKPLPTSRVACLIVAPTLLLGCGGSQKEETPLRGQIETVKLGDLPELGDRMPPLDEGRIEVARPEGWHIPSRSSRWIVRFQASPTFAYPSIIITAEDYEDVFEVSKENVDEFARQVAATFEEGLPTVEQRSCPTTRRAASKAISPAPIQIGPLIGVGYHSRGVTRYRDKKILVERFAIDTVVAGRKYTIELRAREGDLSKYRPHLLAVAGGVKFLEADTAEPPEKKPIETKPKEPPGEQSETTPQKPRPQKPEPDLEYEDEL